MWSHYRKLPPVNSKGTESSTSSELLKKVCQDKTRSTYQQDYVPHIQGRIEVPLKCCEYDQKEPIERFSLSSDRHHFALQFKYFFNQIHLFVHFFFNF